MMFQKSGLWEKVKKRLARGAQIASATSESISKQSKVKINELGIKKQIEEKLLEVGGLVYKKATEKNSLNFEQDLIIKHLIEQIKELELELRQLKAINSKNKTNQQSG